MRYKTDKSQPSGLRPLTNANNYSVRLVKKLRKLISIIFCVVAFELVFGHIALRVFWQGTDNDPQSATYCRVINFPLGERYETHHYVPLLWTVKPKTHLTDLAYQKLKTLVQ